MRRTLIPSLCGVALVAALLPASTAAADTEPDPPELNWGPCTDEELDPGDPAECATLRVPVDYDDPDGETIELAVARRTTDPDQRLGVLVDMPGGPWGSGVNNVLYRQDRFSEELRSRFDVVGFDPRGAGRSTPILCSLDLVAENPSVIIAGPREFRERADYNAALREDCREHTGALYDNADSLTVAHDIESIRRALGEEQLSFYGVSYGTLVGQQYPEYFPHGVRAFALDSVMDHSLDTEAFLHTQAEGMQVSFDAFVDWCESEADCALHGRDVRAFWNDLLDRADAGELDGLDAHDIISATFGFYYGPDWHELAELLLALSEEEGDDEELSSLAATPLGAPARQEIDPELTNYHYPAVLCSDYALPVRNFGHWSRLMQQVERRSAPDMRYSPLAVGDVANCLGHEPVNNPQKPAEVDLDLPLLVGNSLFDPPTGYNWATSLAEQLGDSGRLFTYEGAGHGVYFKSDCVAEVYDRYLIDLEVPEEGASCPPVLPEPLATTMSEAPDAEWLAPGTTMSRVG